MSNDLDQCWLRIFKIAKKKKSSATKLSAIFKVFILHILRSMNISRNKIGKSIFSEFFLRVFFCCCYIIWIESNFWCHNWWWIEFEKERNLNPKIFLEKFFVRKIIRRIISIKYAIFVEKKSFGVVRFAFNFMRLGPNLEYF